MEKTSILNKVGKTVLYAVLAVASFLWVYPFLWMISASFKTQNEFFASGLNLIPQSLNLDNFIRAWNNANFGIYFKNSIIVTVSVVVIVLLSTSLAGYVMGRYSFVGKGLIMKIFMASITIPLVFTVIPIYELLKNIGLSQSLVGLILIWTWNSFLLPLIITLNNPSLRTLAVGLYALRGENVVDWTGIAAGASIAIVPVICVFIALQKYFVDGIAGAVKS